MQTIVREDGTLGSVRKVCLQVIYTDINNTWLSLLILQNKSNNCALNLNEIKLGTSALTVYKSLAYFFMCLRCLEKCKKCHLNKSNLSKPLQFR